MLSIRLTACTCLCTSSASEACRRAIEMFASHSSTSPFAFQSRSVCQGEYPLSSFTNPMADSPATLSRQFHLSGQRCSCRKSLVRSLPMRMSRPDQRLARRRLESAPQSFRTRKAAVRPGFGCKVSGFPEGPTFPWNCSFAPGRTVSRPRPSASRALLSLQYSRVDTECCWERLG